tara:strand:- start:393 stop:503 length:111 start_codon:yes stop_codon:yes gene_type:complete
LERKIMKLLDKLANVNNEDQGFAMKRKGELKNNNGV